MRWRRKQEAGQRLARTEIDQRKPQVGDRVWCAGRPCVITHINADGSTGLAYVRLPATAPGGKPRNR